MTEIAHPYGGADGGAQPLVCNGAWRDALLRSNCWPRGRQPVSEPREQILALVASYGPDVLDLSRTVESELHLLCRDKPREVNSLVAALRHGVVHYLLALAESSKLPAADLPAHVRRLSGESGLTETEAEQAVKMWADIIGAIKMSSTTGVAGAASPMTCLEPRVAALVPVIIVGMAGLLGSMLPWIVVLEERRGGHFLIPEKMSALGTHAVLNRAAPSAAFWVVPLAGCSARLCPLSSR